MPHAPPSSQTLESRRRLTRRIDAYYRLISYKHDRQWRPISGSDCRQDHSIIRCCRRPPPRKLHLSVGAQREVHPATSMIADWWMNSAAGLHRCGTSELCRFHYRCSFTGDHSTELVIVVTGECYKIPRNTRWVIITEPPSAKWQNVCTALSLTFRKVVRQYIWGEVAILNLYSFADSFWI